MEWGKSMVYQHPQTYSFACPQAKQRAVSLKGVFETAGTNII